MSEDDAFATQQGFEILSEDTRISILQVLADEFRDHPEDPVLGFSDLRRAVGMRDSGNFNYHLDKLEGRFVLKTEGGYRIAPAGIEVVAALVTGVYGVGQELGPIDLDDPCPVCNEPLEASYENSLFVVTCVNDHVFQNTLPPGAIDDRDIDAVIELLTLTTKQQMELAAAGICPFCQGQLDWSIDPEQDGGLPEFDNQCERCGVRLEVPAVACLFRHPAVVAFFYDHGIDLRNRPLWAREFYNDIQVRVTSEPVRVAITIELGGDALNATLDSGLDVIEIDR